MGEFQSEVDGIAAAIDELGRYSGERKLRPDDVAEIVGGHAGEVNCYPGTPSNMCCEKAYFISLSIPLAGSSKPHLKFRQALEHLVRHMNGSCKNVTRFAILITDNWDAKAWGEWAPTIQGLNNVYVEAYLLVGGKASRVKF